MPRASGLPLVGSLPRMLWHQFEFLERSFGDKGRIFELDLGVTRAVVVADLGAAEEVLVSKARSFDKGGDFWDGLREVLGGGLPVSEGTQWRRQRRLMQPQFGRRALAGYEQTVVQTVHKALHTFPVGRPVDVEKWCDLLLAEVTVRVLFGTDLDDSRIDELREGMAGLFDALLGGIVTRRLPRWLPVPGRGTLEAGRRLVDRTVTALIDERRRRPGASDDLLGRLLRATDELGEMSDRQLLDEAVTIYIAGYETTGKALAWTLWLLATHPRICAEIQRQLDDDDGSLLKACVHEGLRLYPPSPLVPRRTVVDEVIGGFDVAAGTHVLVCPWLIHRDPELWPCPETFDPGRFLDDGHSRKRSRLAWIPFGVGQRQCIGKSLALVELDRALQTILRRFTPRVSASMPRPTPRLSATLGASRGIFVALHPRAG
ncbi:MAG: cytochrome P450 [Myxococcota bacterium]